MTIAMTKLKPAPAKDKIVGHAVNRVARECMDEADGDWIKAEHLFQIRLAADTNLYSKLSEPLITVGIRHVIRATTYSRRHALLKSTRLTLVGAGKAARGTDGLRRVAATNKATFLDYPLHGGLLLGNAKLADLIKAIEYHARNEAGNAVMKRWLTKISKRVGEQHVRDVFGAGELESLYHEANNA